MTLEEKHKFANELAEMVRKYGIRGMTNTLGLIVMEMAENGETVPYDTMYGDDMQVTPSELISAGSHIKNIYLF